MSRDELFEREHEIYCLSAKKGGNRSRKTGHRKERENNEATIKREERKKEMKNNPKKHKDKQPKTTNDGSVRCLLCFCLFPSHALPVFSFFPLFIVCVLFSIFSFLP